MKQLDLLQVRLKEALDPLLLIPVGIDLTLSLGYLRLFAFFSVDKVIIATNIGMLLLHHLSNEELSITDLAYVTFDTLAITRNLHRISLTLLDTGLTAGFGAELAKQDQTNKLYLPYFGLLVVLEVGKAAITSLVYAGIASLRIRLP